MVVNCRSKGIADMSSTLIISTIRGDTGFRRGEITNMATKVPNDYLTLRCEQR